MTSTKYASKMMPLLTHEAEKQAIREAVIDEMRKINVRNHFHMDYEKKIAREAIRLFKNEMKLRRKK